MCAPRRLERRTHKGRVGCADGACKSIQLHAHTTIGADPEVLIGFASYEVMQGDDGAYYVWLLELHIEEEWRNIKLGTSIVCEVRDRTWEPCRGHIELQVLRANYKAQRLYRRLGLGPKLDQGGSNLHFSTRADPKATKAPAHRIDTGQCQF